MLNVMIHMFTVPLKNKLSPRWLLVPTIRKALHYCTIKWQKAVSSDLNRGNRVDHSADFRSDFELISTWFQFWFQTRLCSARKQSFKMRQDVPHSGIFRNQSGITWCCFSNINARRHRELCRGHCARQLCSKGSNVLAPYNNPSNQTVEIVIYLF